MCPTHRPHGRPVPGWTLVSRPPPQPHTAGYRAVLGAVVVAVLVLGCLLLVVLLR